MGTKSNKKYYRTNLMSKITINDEEYLDLLDFRMKYLLDNITNAVPITYDQNIPLSTLAYRYYRTTSLRWLILYYNGALSEFDLDPGQTIDIPVLNQAASIFARKKANKRGQRVTV